MAVFVSTGPPGDPPATASEAGAPTTTLPEALFQGLAPDGGLFMPGALPRLSAEELSRTLQSGWPGVAEEVAHRLLGNDLDRVALESLVRDALSFPIPLVPITGRVFVLELFRGPTLAFKDVGARFMARLMGHFRKRNPTPLTVLTATSGDTGGAVAHAFRGMPEIRVVVLFPDGKVTPRQERQFSTLGDNVRALAVQGDFDDCQRLAKAAFQDPELRTRASLTSANSINVGRFLPQSFYYFHAMGELARLGVVDAPGAGPWEDGSGAAGRGRGPSVLFSVPSGNFGNLAAGLMAKAMGLERCSFLASTNANDQVPELLRTGIFAPRPSIPTLSTAMDVGNPSNLARILHLYDHDMDRLRDDLVGASISDRETRETIEGVHSKRGYLLDPHSAVGYRALEREMEKRPDALGVLLATAHPAKFAEVVEPIIGESIPLPPELARCMEGERQVTPVEPEMGVLRKVLLDAGGTS